MDLLKTPSTQSLLDSDLESVESLQYVDFEELDEVEYALPASVAPTLAEVLSSEELENENKPQIKNFEDSTTCTALQVDFLQATSQQLTQAQERSSAGAATTLSIGTNGKLTVGTAHGHLLSFHDQTLRWVCDANGDNGAVTCLSYNHDGTRLLAGFARGLVHQYESIRGVILRRFVLGGETWGTLRVTWAGTCGLALDTGGSVWLIKFSRPLGVRSARVSCLFSGARGEVVAMSARDARVLALATLSRVIIVAGGRASGLRMDGPLDVLPVLEWCETDARMLVCARSTIMQWLAVTLNGSSINIRPVQRVELKSSPIWLGWLGGSLAIFDADENLRLWGDDYDKPLDLSQIEPVYSSAFFKGHWTDGRVSRAMCKAGESALGGACISEGTLALLGRRGVVRVKPRDLLARAQAFITSGRYTQALRLLCSSQNSETKKLAIEFVGNLADRPHILSNKDIAVHVVKLCLKYDMSDELWNCLWENCSGEQAFVEALGDAAVRGELSNNPPSPDFTQEPERRIEVIEFIAGQLHAGALPLDQEVIKKLQELVSTTDTERADRAWLAVLTRIRNQRDQMLLQYRGAILRPRILWRIDTMLERHDEALKEFLDIQHPSDQDIDEFFAYLRSRVESEEDARNRIRPYFPALVELRPRLAAALLNDDNSIDIYILDSLSTNSKIEFSECLLEMGRLRGDAAATYLRNLGVVRPKDVKNFLVKNPGIIRPEDALSIVRELRLQEAEPVCLEATGDYAGALEALLRLISSSEDEEAKAELIGEASALCLRVAPTVPPRAAADMWSRLLRSVGAVPPTLLFEAIAFLPIEELVVQTCESSRVALAILADGAARREVWRCGARALRREAHEALARALAAARRGLAVRGACRRCGGALAARGGARTSHCARAFHADCAPEHTCACGRRAPAAQLSLPALPRRVSAPHDYGLQLVAPPRPDLEGVV